MYSSELRSTFSQELGAALRDHLHRKLAELANDNALDPTLRNEAQRIQDMLTTSYDCTIFDPSNGIREMITPTAIILADDKRNVNTPLLVLLVDFSKNQTDHTAARLLDMYPDTIIIRVDIPYLNPKARIAASRAGNTASPYTCWYDIIIRASTTTANPAPHDGESSSTPSSPSSSDRLHFLVRSRPLLQHRGDGEERPLEISLLLLLPELTWRVSLAHPAAASAGQLSIRLRCATLRRCLDVAAVRQKNTDMLPLRLEGRRPPQHARPLGNSGVPPSRGLHSLASSSGPAPTRRCAVGAVVEGGSDGPAASRGGRGFGLKFARFGGRVSGAALAVGGSGGPQLGVASLRTLLGFSWRLARGGRC